MGLFDKFKKNEKKDELPTISKNDMERIHDIMEYIKQHDHDFYTSLQNLSLYAVPLESNTNLLPLSEIAHTMISSLHCCIEAKKRLNSISEVFLSSDTYKRFMISFTDGFIFDELERISTYSESELKMQIENNYFAYFYAYVLGLIDRLPANPEGCDEIKLCTLITKFNSYGEMLNNCKMLDKESILYIADSLALESIHYIYKEKNNIHFDEKDRNYKIIQRSCSFYVLSYNFDDMKNKLEKVQQ